MSLHPNQIVEGKRYSRFSEIRLVTKITASGELEYKSTMGTDTGGYSSQSVKTTVEKFAHEVDREV
jgi:hypothetical protein